MDAKIVCINPNCKQELKRPPVPFIKCPNCKTQFFVFCHQFPYKTFSYNDCKKCNTQLYYFFCFKCQSVLSYKKYRMGSVAACKCGFKGCYVVCNHCKKPECYPPERRYEGVSWKCIDCKKPFNFMTCDACYHPIYNEKFTEGTNFNCQNVKCRVNLTVKKCNACRFIFMTQNFNQNTCEPCQRNPPPVQNNNPVKEPAKSSTINQTKIQPMQSNTTTSDVDKNLCKICLDKPAQYLNVKCFHLTCCNTCMPSMKNTCPLCRAVGQYRKVFT